MIITKSLVIAAISAIISAQAPPSPVLLTSTKSGVLPIAPTPFNGLETNEGALIYGGPPLNGFTGPGGNASVQSNLPVATYTAVLPPTNFDNLTGSTITGSISGVSKQGSNGVTFTLNFTGFPDAATYGPFGYHIHTLPVTNGNCTTSMGHLDPTNRGELYACQVGAPQTCQAGDLAGKHGNITAASFTASYTDPYLSTDPSSPYYFGDKSIVIHSRNATRLTCANFARAGSGTNSTSNNSTGSSSPGSGAGSSPTNGSSSGTATSNGAVSGWNPDRIWMSAIVVAIGFFFL